MVFVTSEIFSGIRFSRREASFGFADFFRDR